MANYPPGQWTHALRSTARLPAVAAQANTFGAMPNSNESFSSVSSKALVRLQLSARYTFSSSDFVERTLDGQFILLTVADLKGPALSKPLAYPSVDLLVQYQAARGVTNADWNGPRGSLVLLRAYAANEETVFLTWKPVGFEHSSSILITHHACDSVDRLLNTNVPAGTVHSWTTFSSTRVAPLTAEENIARIFRYTNAIPRFRSHLNKYQQCILPAALNAVLNNDNYGIYWQPGLGKTLQAISITRESGLVTLVVCPSSLTKQWEEQVQKWEPELSCTIAGDSNDLRRIGYVNKRSPSSLWQFTIVTPEMLEKIATSPKSFPEIHMVCVDEAAKYLTLDVLEKLPKLKEESKSIVLMSGTPTGFDADKKKMLSYYIPSERFTVNTSSRILAREAFGSLFPQFFHHFLFPLSEPQKQKLRGWLHERNSARKVRSINWTAVAQVIECLTQDNVEDLNQSHHRDVFMAANPKVAFLVSALRFWQAKIQQNRMSFPGRKILRGSNITHLQVLVLVDFIASAEQISVVLRRAVPDAHVVKLTGGDDDRHLRIKEFMEASAPISILVITSGIGSHGLDLGNVALSVSMRPVSSPDKSGQENSRAFRSNNTISVSLAQMTTTSGFDFQIIQRHNERIKLDMDSGIDSVALTDSSFQDLPELFADIKAYGEEDFEKLLEDSTRFCTDSNENLISVLKMRPATLPITLPDITPRNVPDSRVVLWDLVEALKKKTPRRIDQGVAENLGSFNAAVARLIHLNHLCDEEDMARIEEVSTRWHHDRYSFAYSPVVTAIMSDCWGHTIPLITNAGGNRFALLMTAKLALLDTLAVLKTLTTLDSLRHLACFTELMAAGLSNNLRIPPERAVSINESIHLLGYLLDTNEYKRIVEPIRHASQALEEARKEEDQALIQECKTRASVSLQQASEIASMMASEMTTRPHVVLSLLQTAVFGSERLRYIASSALASMPQDFVHSFDNTLSDTLSSMVSPCSDLVLIVSKKIYLIVRTMEQDPLFSDENSNLHSIAHQIQTFLRTQQSASIVAIKPLLGSFSKTNPVFATLKPAEEILLSTIDYIIRLHLKTIGGYTTVAAALNETMSLNSFTTVEQYLAEFELDARKYVLGIDDPVGSAIISSKGNKMSASYDSSLQQISSLEKEITNIERQTFNVARELELVTVALDKLIESFEPGLSDVSAQLKSKDLSSAIRGFEKLQQLWPDVRAQLQELEQRKGFLKSQLDKYRLTIEEKRSQITQIQNGLICTVESTIVKVGPATPTKFRK